MAEEIRWSSITRAWADPIDWYIDVVNPDADLQKVLDLNKVVVRGPLRVQVDWPLQHQYAETHEGEGFMRGDVARIVCDMYRRYYKAETGVQPGCSVGKADPFDVANLQLVSLGYSAGGYWRPSVRLRSRNSGN